MAMRSPASSFIPNAMYAFSGPSDKVYMAVVEEGLFLDSVAAVRFNPNTMTYLSKIQRKLAGEVAPEVVELEKDDLLEKGLLISPAEMQRFPVGRGKYVWAEGFKVDPEVASACFKMYKLCHDRN